jgi:hypothetical protein
MKPAVPILLAVAIAACSPTKDEAVNVAPAQAVKNENPPATATEARVEGMLPADRTPLIEPKGPIDIKGVEAAGQVVQHYGALVEKRRWLKAERLWGDVGAARKFASALGSAYREIHVEIGPPGEAEGAAGSTYVTEGVTFYGKSSKGADLRRPAEIILRRVNDVPGSTEEERRWHIERIDWKEGR